MICGYAWGVQFLRTEAAAEKIPRGKLSGKTCLGALSSAHWCGKVWYGVCMVWYGVCMVWYVYGVVWYGMVWYGMVWYGTKFKASEPSLSPLPPTSGQGGGAGAASGGFGWRRHRRIPSEAAAGASKHVLGPFTRHTTNMTNPTSRTA